MKYLIEIKGHYDFRRQGIKCEYIINPSLYNFLFVNPKVEKRYKIVNGYDSDEIVINKQRFNHVVVRKKDGSVSNTILLNYIECERNELKNIIKNIKIFFENTIFYNECKEFIKDYNPRSIIKFDGIIDIQ